MFRQFLASLIVGFIVIGCSSDVQFDLPRRTDNFQNSITYNNKVDILWIVDDSSSMGKHQQSLNQQLPALMEALNRLKMDYHMAAVTTTLAGASAGKFIGNPKYITPQTPQFLARLTERLVVGENGSNLERGLEAMEASLSPDYLSSEGKGFLREDALLVVIALSDEEDGSTQSNPVDYYTRFLDSVKKPWVDGSRSWVFNFIGVLESSSQCRTFNDYSSLGYTFMGLVDASGGRKESICTSNLASAVSNIRARIYEIITDYKLSKKPLVESIQVYMGSELIPRSQDNGWDYIEEINSIRFYGSAVPAADAPVRVDFKPRDAN